MKNKLDALHVVAITLKSHEAFKGDNMFIEDFKKIKESNQSIRQHLSIYRTRKINKLLYGKS